MKKLFPSAPAIPPTEKENSFFQQASHDFRFPKKPGQVTAIVLLVFFSHLLFANYLKKTEHPLQQQARQWMQNRPVKFLENKGQMVDMENNPVPFVLFKAEAPGMNMYITEKGITYLFVKPEEKEHKKEIDSKQSAIDNQKNKNDENIQVEWNRIDMELKGASIKQENIIKETASVTDFNFFLGHCPEGIYGVKEYQKIIIGEIYQGIDWVLYNTGDNGFKYDFIVHPGADYKQIELIYSSLNPLNLNKYGGIEIKTNIGTLSEQTPFSYIKETNQQVTTNFHITDQKHINKQYYKTTITCHLPDFQLSNYQTLIIDPLIIPVLTWGTYYGGNSLDGLSSIATDGSGNLFVTGYMSSTNIPTNSGGGAYFQSTNAGTGDAFILKFSNAGVLLWGTYYGGSGSGSIGQDYGLSIATDGSGNVFVTGHTNSPNFPLQNSGGYYQIANGGGRDAFILKFTNAGIRQWATYYGGGASDYGNSICTDGSGNVFVTGVSSSSLPTLNLAGAYFQSASAGGNDAFILKFTNTGVRLWATYYGTNSTDMGYSIATDVNGNVFVTGITDSPSFPTQNSGGYFQPANAGGFDAFILKFTNAGVRQWATYYGGSGDDQGICITADINGNVFVAGQTNSSNLPTLAGGGYFQPANAGSDDVFILKFNNAQVRQWATYYGGSGRDILMYNSVRGKGIIADAVGDVFVTGYTNSPNFPTLSSGGYYQSARSGTEDIFILQFSNTGVRKWATYNGTPGGAGGNELAAALAIDPINGCLFAAGEWTGNGSNGLADPGGGAYYDATWNTTDDGYIMKFCSPCTAPSATVSSTSASCTANNGTATVIASGAAPPYTYLWNPGGQTTPAATGLTPGTYIVTVTESGGCSQSFTVSVSSIGTLTVNTTSTQTGCTSNIGTASATPSGGTPAYTYGWSNGQTTPTATGLGTGTYTVTVKDANGCTQTQTVIVTSSGTFILSMSSTQTGCTTTTGTASATPSGGTPAYTYSWSNGQTTATATGLGAGTYTVTVTDASGCTQTQTVTVTSSSTLTLTTTSTQTGCTINIGTASAVPSGGTPAYTYSWNNGQTTATATGLGAGTYIVTVTDASGCTQTQTVTVTTLSGTIATANANPVVITAGDSTQLSATGGGTYFWSNGATGAVITVSPSVTTAYCVTVTDNNSCTDTACVTVIVAVDCSGAGELYLPNTFSPNNDGVNDLLQIYYGNIKCIKTFNLVIYNRWGEKVFETTNPIEGWDGSYGSASLTTGKGKLINTAVFVYYLDATLINGEQIIKKGSISLIR